VCFDPSGANIDVWEAKGMPGTDVDPAAHGAPSWFESMTTDVERASAFYGGLFGWKAQPSPKLGPSYTTFLLDSTYVAGIGARAERSDKAAPAWVTYFTVTDAAAAARKAAELGATITEPVRDVPGVGRACGITSPQGVPFQVIEYAR
jgi:predicted enzyme related to lactoylglutathione lyase